MKKKNLKTVPILIHFSKNDLKKIDRLVKEGFYASRTEAVRDAVRRMIEELSREEKIIKRVTDEEVDRTLKEWIEENPYERLKRLGFG